MKPRTLQRLSKPTSAEHFARLRETSEVVWPFVDEFLDRHASASAPGLREALEFFAQRRRHQPLLRPYLTRLSYEAAGGRDWRSHARLFAATELFNISTYQSNLCFDEKIGNGRTTTTEQFIASMLTISEAIVAAALHQYAELGSRATAACLLATSNAEVYVGQHIDTAVLTLGAFDEVYRSDSTRFLDLYLRRCELIGSSTFNVCAIGALAGSTPFSAIRGALAKFFRGLGVAGQILNDLADFIPNGARSYSQAYADVRLGRLTWPVYALAAETGLPQRAAAERACGVDDTHLLCEMTHWLKTRNIRGKTEALLQRWAAADVEAGILEVAEVAGDSVARNFLFSRSFMFGSRNLRYFERSAAIGANEGGDGAKHCQAREGG